MRAGGTAAKRGSLATRSSSARLRRAQGMGGHRPDGLGPAIAVHEAVAGSPALQGADVDARSVAGGMQPCSRALSDLDVVG